MVADSIFAVHRLKRPRTANVTRLSSGFSKLRSRCKLKHVGKVLRCLLMERLESEYQDLEINPFLNWQPMKMNEIVGYWIIHVLPLVSD